jgi:hypothetical protein
MRFLFTNNGREYLVDVDEAGLDGCDEVMATFIARTEKGKGRMPKPRMVSTSELRLLVDYHVASAV